MSKLLVRPTAPRESDGQVLNVTPESAGWDYVGFAVHQLADGQAMSGGDVDKEVCLVVITGKATVNAGNATVTGGTDSATTAEDTAVTQTLTVTDPDGVPATGAFGIAGAADEPASGSVTIDPDSGEYTYTPDL